MHARAQRARHRRILTKATMKTGERRAPHAWSHAHPRTRTHHALDSLFSRSSIEGSAREPDAARESGREPLRSEDPEPPESRTGVTGFDARLLRSRLATDGSSTDSTLSEGQGARDRNRHTQRERESERESEGETHRETRTRRDARTTERETQTERKTKGALRRHTSLMLAMRLTQGRRRTRSRGDGE